MGLFDLFNAKQKGTAKKKLSLRYTSQGSRDGGHHIKKLACYKKKDAEPSSPVILAADAAGRFVKMEDIPDEVFAQGILGQCCGIDPEEGRVYAPCDGEVTHVPDTLHAVSITAPSGVEVLIHVGVDTVEMKGDGFEAKVAPGSKVAKGQLVLTMDLKKIREAGHPAVVITVVTNTDDFTGVQAVATGNVKPGDELLQVIQ